MSEDRSQNCIQITGDHPFCQMVYNQFIYHDDAESVRPAIITTRTLTAEVRLSKPDILVLQADDSFVDCLQVLDELESPPRLVVVSANHDPDLILAREHDFTWATLLPDMVTSPLFMAVLEAVLNNFTYHTAPPEIAENYRFTPLEICVLRLMAVGFNNNQLVTQLDRCLDSMYYTQRRIRVKLKVETNEQALIAAIQEGVVSMLERRGDPLAESQAA
jgi:DNA-binding NarL/FixJ family response regulator